MTDRDFILTSSSVATEFVYDPALICLHSLQMINLAENYSGVDNWVVETYHHMTPEQRMANELVTEELLHGLVLFDHPGLSFPQYLEVLAASDPVAFRDRAIAWMEKPQLWWEAADVAFPGYEAVLGSVDVYLDFIRALASGKVEKMAEFREDYLRRLHELLNQPEALLDFTVTHLAYMWETFLEAEWKRVAPRLQETAEAFSQMDYTGLNLYEVIEAVTERDLRGSDKIENAVATTMVVRFSPSPHLGPYVSWFPAEQPHIWHMFFSARLPKGFRTPSPALSRSELLVRLSALADDTRLQMLELLAQHEELCAQDFITMLDLSQSSASRHLRQLTATGFIKERRREIAKCYSLNRERIGNTVTALSGFLRSSAT